MKKKILPIIFSLFFIPVLAQYVVKGGSGTPFLAKDDSQNHTYVYLLDGLQNARISFTSTTPGAHQWHKYKDKASESDPVVPSTQTGNTSEITDISDGYGYYVGETNSSATYYLWIIDYSKYLPVLNSLTIQEDESKCEFIYLIPDVNTPPLSYNKPLGGAVKIARTFTLSYSTLKWNEKNLVFDNNTVNEKWTEPLSKKSVNAPLKNTDFTLAGDLFSEHFGLKQTVKTPEYEAIAVEAHGEDDRKAENADNEINPTPENTGDSAPVDITFTAYANEPVAGMYIWKIMKKGSENLVARYTDKVLHHKFTESGDFLVQLEVVGRNPVCADSLSTPIEVSIGTSILKIPNAFSPGSSDGVNDEFKVAYKSIVKFNCKIFNRWGNKLYEWSDPAQGWDGRVDGKLVPTGVYFCVINAVGADGKTHKKQQAITILRGKN